MIRKLILIACVLVSCLVMEQVVLGDEGQFTKSVQPNSPLNTGLTDPNQSLLTGEINADDADAVDPMLKARMDEAKRAYERMQNGQLRLGDKDLIEEFFPHSPSHIGSNGTLDDNGGTWFSWSGSLPIPDAQCPNVVYAPITVAGAGTSILDIDVRIDSLIHTYDMDLSIWIEGPTGIRSALYLNRDGSGDNLIRTVFDDEAGVRISVGSAPFTGSFRPEVPLSGFDGTDPNGEWKLMVCDFYEQDTGTLRAWSIQIKCVESAEHDFSTVSITRPATGTSYVPGASIPVQALVKNVGLTTESAPLKYRFNGGAIIAENTAALSYLSTEDHLFASTLTLPAAIGSYELEVWTDVPGDANRGNDTVRSTIAVMTCDLTIPLTETFDGVPTPDMPLCWRHENTDGVNPVWQTSSARSHSASNSAFISWRDPSINDWLFSRGMQLTGGVTYQLTYWHATRNATYHEALEVMLGTAQNSAAMTWTLQSRFTFNQTAFVQEIIGFTPLTSGIYYLGWHATSEDAYGLYLDDISVTVGQQFSRCCYMENSSPACANTTESGCSALQGQWTYGESCIHPCPVVVPGGETCANPIEISDAGTWIGGTCGKGNDYQNTCLNDYDSGEDIIYRWTVSATDVYDIEISTPYTDSIGVAVSTLCPPRNSCLLYNESNDGVVLFSCVSLTAGTYYITVDSYGAASCSPYFAMRIQPCRACTIEPQAGDIIEPAVEAPDFTIMDADPNGGCNSSTQGYGEISCGQTIYGLAFTYTGPGSGSYRDTDWYRFELTQPETLTVLVEAEFPVACYILDLNCAETGLVASVINGLPCTMVPMYAGVVNPGTYNLFVAPYAFSGIVYPSHYRVTLRCAADEILPVELASFTADAGDNQVSLHWATASETQNDRFDIERNGVTVGSVDAAGAAHAYSWVDDRVQNGNTYDYTLVSVSISGERENLRTVTATPRSNELNVTEYALHANYPNPFNPTTDIVFDMKETAQVDLSVYNLLGQNVTTLVNGSLEAGRHTVRFNATNLPSGLYICKMKTGEFTSQMKMMLLK